MITVNAANPENGTTQSPSIGRTKYKALNPAAIKYGAAATTPASSRARAAKKSATAAGNKTTARSRACRFEKSARRVTEGSFVGLTTAVQPRRLLPRMMPQRPTAVGCNRWLGGRWALKDFDRVVVAWLWLLNRKPRGPRNRRLERVEQAMLVDRELPRHVVAGER